MTGSDDEFEDFLKRRKPVFRSPDDLFEPPAELDRVVLRQAREATEYMDALQRTETGKLQRFKLRVLAK